MTARPRLVTIATLALVAIATTSCIGEAAQAPGSRTETQMSSPEPTVTPRAAGKKKRAPLPRGGHRIFPRFRVVAFYGAAGTDELGVLGEGSPRKAAQRVEEHARAFRGFGRPVLPALELIASVATSSRGAGGDYSSPTAFGDVRSYLKAARSIDGLLVLDIQPGQGSFMSEVKRYKRFLKEPDVGLALDPEWSMHGGDVPAEEIGFTTARVVNRVSAYLARIVRQNRLPQKLLVLHEFTTKMIRNRDAIKPRRALAITFHVDGFGGRAAKLSKYDVLSVKEPFYNGFKLFFDEDVDMFSAREVMKGLRPRPDLITYQ